MSVTRAPEPVVPPDGQAPAAGAARKVEIVVSVPTVVKALGIFFGVLLVFIVRDALLSIALSLVFVLGLDPPVSALVRRGWGRGSGRWGRGGCCWQHHARCEQSSGWRPRPLWAAEDREREHPGKRHRFRGRSTHRGAGHLGVE